MSVQMKGQLQLGADAVGAGHQHRLLVLLADLEQRAESADAGQHAFTHRAFCKWLDRLDEGIAGIDIDACITIRKGNRRIGRHGGIKE